MTNGIPLEIEHLRTRLQQDFGGLLPPVTKGSSAEREANLLTRALAAFVLVREAGAEQANAAGSVVDGGGDGGIDALHYNSIAVRLWVVQSKFIRNGIGEPSLGDVAKFKDGVQALLEGRFSFFDQNNAVQQRIPELAQAFAQSGLQVIAVLVYSGNAVVSEDRLRLFEALRNQVRTAEDDDYLVFKRFNLTSVHDWITGANEPGGIDIEELMLHCPGRSADPYLTYYGLVSLKDLAMIHSTHGRELVTSNIRHYKGSTDVNRSIANTIREDGAHFHYFNNGLTAFCRKVNEHNLDRNRWDQKRLAIEGFSVVNGAQTLGALGSCGLEPDEVPEGFAFLRLISLEKCEDETTFAEKVTRSTNYQNQLGSRAFVALDPEQHRIAAHLEQSDVHYHYKEDAAAPEPDENNFDLIEATDALACLVGDIDLARRVLADRRSLWSQGEDYPGEAIQSRYHRLFRPERTARTIWRAVQTKRLVSERCLESGRAEGGSRQQFFQNARWIILHIVFIRLRPELADSLFLSADEKAAIREETDKISEVLWTPSEQRRSTRHFKSVFCDSGDCPFLKAEVMQALSKQDETDSALG